MQKSDSAGTARYSSGRSSLHSERGSVCLGRPAPPPALLMWQPCHCLEKTLCLQGWEQCSVCGGLTRSTKGSADFANVTVQTDFPTVKTDQFLPATVLDIFECFFPSLLETSLLSIVLFVLLCFTCELPLTHDFILIFIRIEIIGILRKVKKVSKFKIALGAAVFKLLFFLRCWSVLNCANLCVP